MSEFNFLGNLIIKGKLRCETGLLIGGNQESTEIGGIDNPVIRDPNGYPYIPGSSLKGKMRSLVEWEEGLVGKDGDVHTCKDEDKAKNCPVCIVFGCSSDKDLKIGPTRLIVRDAYATEETKEWWKSLDTGLLYTEWKKENTINRLTSRANPRDFERVPAGSEFEVEFVFGLYQLPNSEKKDYNYIPVLFKAIALLEDSYLGGSGTRGYGKVKFNLDQEAIFISKEDYQQGRREGKKVSIEKLKSNPEDVLSKKEEGSSDSEV